MPHKRNRFWHGLKPVKMSLPEFHDQPTGIFANDLETELLDKKNHSNEIKVALKSLADKAIKHDNQKKLAELSVAATELAQQRQQPIAQKKADAEKPSFFRHQSKENHSATLVIRNLKRQLAEEKDEATKIRLTRELAIAEKSAAMKQATKSWMSKNTAAVKPATEEKTLENWIKL